MKLYRHLNTMLGFSVSASLISGPSNACRPTMVASSLLLLSRCMAATFAIAHCKVSLMTTSAMPWANTSQQPLVAHWQWEWSLPLSVWCTAPCALAATTAPSCPLEKRLWRRGCCRQAMRAPLQGLMESLKGKAWVSCTRLLLRGTVHYARAILHATGHRCGSLLVRVSVTVKACTVMLKQCKGVLLRTCKPS